MVRPSDAHDFHMTICEIIPKDDGKATSDVAVEFAVRFVECAVIGVPFRKIANRFKPSQKEIPVPFFQFTRELKNDRVNQQPPLHASGGSGMRLRRALNSSPDNQRPWSGSSRFCASDFAWPAHFCSRSEIKNENNSRRALSSSAAASCFKVSKLMRRQDHVRHGVATTGAECPSKTFFATRAPLIIQSKP